eukprot:jgi/Ulvmu1/7583/UM038_0006.1
MDTESEDDLFGVEEEEDELDEDEEWDLIWDAGVEDGEDIFDDVDGSSIDESVDMAAEVLEGHMRDRSAMTHEVHQVVLSVLGDKSAPHTDHGNVNYSPLDLSACGASLLPSSKTHNQTCDSCCYGPVTPEGDFVTVIEENGNDAGRVHMVNVAGVQGRGRNGPSIPPHDQILALPDLRMFGRDIRIYGCYSCRWSEDHSYLGISTAVSRVSFWVRKKTEIIHKEDPPKHQNDDRSSGHSLQPCGSMMIPELDYHIPGMPVREVLSRCRLMLNCIRFGSVAGVQRALVAGQNGGIYVFEIPPVPTVGKKPPAGADFICHSLRPPNAPGRFGSHTELMSDLLMGQQSNEHDETLKMPIVLEDTLVERMPDLREMTHAADVLRTPIVQECLSETRVLTRLSGAVNCAQPSPCGRWVAVLTDSMTVMLLPEALDYKLRCGMLLLWPDVGRPSRTSTCIGCQYVAWSSDGQYLAVSSDSHKAVSIWRVRLKHDTALDAESLGNSLTAALLEATKSRKSSANAADLNASELREYLPAAHSEFLEQLPSGRTMRKSGSRGRRGGHSGRMPDVNRDAMGAGSGHKKSAFDVRNRILRILGAGLWEKVQIEHLCSYKDHENACLSLTFVLGTPAMLCWAEERGRVHLCDVRRPQARQCIHLCTLPIQIAFANDELQAIPPSTADNWGLLWGGAEGDAVCGGEDDIPLSLQLQPIAKADAARTVTPPRSDVSQAVQILRKTKDVLHSTGGHSIPAAMVFALIQGHCVRVPKRLAEVGRELQRGLDAVMKDEVLHADTEASLMELMMSDVGQGADDLLMVGIRAEAAANTITGITAAGNSTIVVTTTTHAFRLKTCDKWDLGMAWPYAFWRAVQEVLKVHHRQARSVRAEGEAMRLGDMPRDVMRLIIQRSAGERIDWICEADDSCEEFLDRPELCGLTRQQCFSTSFMNVLHVPVNLVSGLLCQ